MATLSVLKFETPDGAKQMEQTLLSLQKQQLITIQDAAIVTWPQGKKGPKTEQLHSLAGQGALMGAFWGMLFGLIFFIPFFGLDFGAVPVEQRCGDGQDCACSEGHEVRDHLDEPEQGTGRSAARDAQQRVRR